MRTYRMLIRLAQQGEREAITEIVADFEHMIHSVSWQAGGSPDDRDEAVSIAKCALVESIFAYDLTRPADVPFYFWKAMRAGLDRERRARERRARWHVHLDDDGARRLEDIADTSLEPAGDRLIRQEEQAALQEAMQSLTAEEQYLLLQLHRSRRDLAEELHLSVQQIQRRQEKAMDTLRRAWHEQRTRKEENDMNQYIGKPWKDIPQEQQCRFLRQSKIKGFRIREDGTCTKGCFWFSRYGTYVDGESVQYWDGTRCCTTLFVHPDSIVKVR